jgi:4-hydroxy-2-oxoheptanedioate aldolase
MCHTDAGLGLLPIVRIPAPDPYAAKMVLDGGAAGVVAPYVETPEQVRALRGAVKLRPRKGKMLDGLLDGGAAEPELAQYLAPAAQQRLLIVNIESVPAIAALDAIRAEPGLDAGLIGPHDLLCSLSIPERYWHPKFRAAARPIFQKMRAPPGSAPASISGTSGNSRGLGSGG